MNNEPERGLAAPVTPLRPMSTSFKSDAERTSWVKSDETTGTHNGGASARKSDPFSRYGEASPNKNYHWQKSPEKMIFSMAAISNEVAFIEELEIRPTKLFQDYETMKTEPASLESETTPVAQLSAGVSALNLSDSDVELRPNRIVPNLSVEEFNRAYGLARIPGQPLKMSPGLCNSALEHNSHGNYYVCVASPRMMTFLRGLPLEAFNLDFDIPVFGSLKVSWSNIQLNGSLMQSPRVVYRIRRCLVDREYGSIAIGFVLPASGWQAQEVQHLMVPLAEWSKKRRYLPQGWKEMLLASALCGVAQLDVLERFGVLIWLQSGGPATTW
ncbi:hypothetical protein FRB93_000515 [Tulasnella sp. JGI-2019a]|nr:hypothetical protein FRB93_000515 [Tulasnella sp. JGI-2019a]